MPSDSVIPKEQCIEEWRPVVGFEGYYEVSNLGRVRSLIYQSKHGSRPRQLPKVLSTAHPKRPSLTLCGVEKATRRVHRLVALAFLGPPPTPAHQVAHRDGNARNNAASNLMWATSKENESHKILHGTKNFGARNVNAKLTNDQAAEIRRLYCSGILPSVIARRFNMHHSQVWRIGKRRSWCNLIDSEEKQP